MIIKTGIPLLLLLVLQGCFRPDRGGSPATGPEGSCDYARGFRIERYEDFSLLHVSDPWQGALGVEFRYLLAHDPERVPDSLGQIVKIRTPVSRVICMSTTHVAMIDALGMTGAIVGISGPEYISNRELRKDIDEGRVRDVGADQALNLEQIVSLKPDLVFAYGITADINGMVRRLGDLGIPVVLNGDYLENKPLGKSEWLKFMAAFFELDSSADSIFARVREEYESYRRMAADVDSRPLVMTGLPWKDAWYVPGGRSFAASFIRDAGGQYVWEDVDSREAAPVDLESVYARAAEADLWINSGSALSLEDIRQTEPRLVHMKAFREGEVYNNTARLNPEGGNDFWEKGVMEPQLILADLIRIFHPGILPGHELRYYQQLQ
jgi:iron complex transport system substrate-binding protein